MNKNREHNYNGVERLHKTVHSKSNVLIFYSFIIINGRDN